MEPLRMYWDTCPGRVRILGLAGLVSAAMNAEMRQRYT